MSPRIDSKSTGPSAALRRLLRKESARARWNGPKGGTVRLSDSPGIGTPTQLKMRATGFLFDSLQIPLNAFDAHFRSFGQLVLLGLNLKNGVVE
jgi:hypothetical protein